MSDQSTKPRRRNSLSVPAVYALGLGWIMATDTSVAGPAREPAPKVAISSVKSSGQRNGVTAGYVGQLTQTVLPTLVRGPQLEKFKAAFTAGAKLNREFVVGPMDDARISILLAQSDKWANDTYAWLHRDVSEYAAERFAFRPPPLSMSWNLPGEHAAGFVQRWGDTRQALSASLVNLDQLMRDPSIYPEPAGK
jgi:hypothetical protein